MLNGKRLTLTGRFTSTWLRFTGGALTAPWSGPVQLFTLPELRDGLAHLRQGKAVGSDKTSAELLFGLVAVEGGEEQLLAWCVARWNEPVLVMLPQIAATQSAKELRPPAMGSAVCKLFCRLLLCRAMPRPCPSTGCPSSGAQTSGPGRQSGDYLFSIWRLLELTCEWGNPLVVFKLDVAKAFDCPQSTRVQAGTGGGAQLLVRAPL